MRLACESCAAVYLIDDGAMTPRGVRSQCPRCKNIQYVPPPPDPRANPATRARDMANPISVSRPPVVGTEVDPEGPARSQVARVTLTTRMVARPPAPPPEALQTEGPEARAELFGELAWSDAEAAEGATALQLQPSANSPPPAPPGPPGPPPAAAFLDAAQKPPSFLAADLFASEPAGGPASEW